MNPEPLHLHGRTGHSYTPSDDLQFYSQTRRCSRVSSSKPPNFLCFSAALFLYLFSTGSVISFVDGGKGGAGSRNAGVDRECNGIGNVIRNKGFTYPWWDTSPVGLMMASTNNSSASTLDDSTGNSGCPVGSTGTKGVNCCKAFDTVIQKNEIGSMFNDKWMGPKLSSSAEIFKERKKKFDVTFKDLLTRAHGSFHAMFERTVSSISSLTVDANEKEHLLSLNKREREINTNNIDLLRRVQSRNWNWSILHERLKKGPHSNQYFICNPLSRYGMLYIQHAPIFHALFTTLETYYDTGRDSLEAKLNEFFAILTRKMFEVLNAQYDFDETYLSCATIVVSEKQGGDLHRQIVSSLRRSFVATRALAQGLSEADRVLTNLLKIKVPNDCLQSLSQMLHCPVCAEQRAYKPCIPLCTSVATKCLLSTASMNKPWTEFTNALEGILDRLLGPYNVEAVVEPIHIKISEAIMNFQESGTDLSQAVFSKCGKPKLKSATRSFHRRNAELPLIPNMKPEKFGDNTDDSEDNDKQDDTELMQGDRHGDHRAGAANHDDTQPSKSLEKLLKEIKNKVKKSKVMWNVLPKQVCNGISKDYSSQLCWNGSFAIKPDRNKSAEENESGLPPGKGPPNILVAEQVLILQLITDKLRASYNGLDVQWVQDVADELDFDASGNGGAGSGSGAVPDDLEDSDDDDPSGRIKQDLRPQTIPSTTTTTGYNTPQRPKFPLRPAPPILNSNPYGGNNGRDEDEDDDDDDSDGNIRNWNIDPPTFYRPTSTGGGDQSGGSDIDFDPPLPPYQAPSPPKVNKAPSLPPIAPFPIPTTVPTSTTSTTKKPGTGSGDLDVKKTTVNSSGHGGDASSAIAVFKLFSPIIVSMIGKVFSFS